MNLLPELEAIRTCVAHSRDAQPTLLALRGDDARDALLHLLPSRLFLRDAQVKESLLLSSDGHPIADVLVCADDGDYLLIVEGLSPEATRAHVEAHLPSGTSPVIEDMGETHEVLSLHGPWSWQLAAAVLGEDLVALPYLNFFRVEPGICVRAGKTGEYGYDLVVRREMADEVWASIQTISEALSGREVGAEALSLCRFENWFFDPAHVPDGVTPLELQLSWRLDMGREWVGSAAIASREVTRRLTCMASKTEVAAGEVVRYSQSEIGRVVRAERSPIRDEWIVAALVDLAYAHGGIDAFVAGDAPVRTTAPPLIDNRSLYIDPRRHTWAARDEVPMRPLVRGSVTSESSSGDEA